MGKNKERDTRERRIIEARCFTRERDQAKIIMMHIFSLIVLGLGTSIFSLTTWRGFGSMWRANHKFITTHLRRSHPLSINCGLDLDGGINFSEADLDTIVFMNIQSTWASSMSARLELPQAGATWRLD